MDVDSIVIGSGAGGLTAALALARGGDRVLVLEQHYLPGGWCHSFPLGGYQFNTGVHYVGTLGPGGGLRRIYEGLGVTDDLVFCELNPDGYDTAMVGGQRYRYRKGRERLTEGLASAFPAESAGVRRFIDTMFRVEEGTAALAGARSGWDALKAVASNPTWLRFGPRPLRAALDAHVKDPVARAVLSLQAGDYGLPPSKAPTALHAGLMAHYAEGAWYPLGGGRAIPRAFLHALRRAGGKIQVKARVERILTEPEAGGGHRALGVRLADGTEIRARRVISNADPEVTYRRLLDEGLLSLKLRTKLDQTKWSCTGLSLFLAAEIEPAEYGLDSGNLWYFNTPDLETMYDPNMDLETITEFPGMFLTVTTLKDPSKRKGKAHTLEAFVLVPWDPFARWQGSDPESRPSAYLALKARLQDAMMRTVERVIPDIRARTVFADIGTPLTHVHYCNSTRGSWYGTEKTLGQLGPRSYGLKSEVAGLYLCGASTVMHGVSGATISGLAAAARALGVRTSELLASQGPSLRLVPAEQPEAWPEDLRAKFGHGEAEE